MTSIHPESVGSRAIDLALLGNRTLQTLIRGNCVCFPSQAPIFGQKSRRDLQWRLAVLYFVRGWSTRSIANRYGITRERCGQIISDWRIRAVALGYIQDVTPEGTDLARVANPRTLTQFPGPASAPAPAQAATAIAVKNATISRTSLAMSAGPRSPSILR